MREKRQKKLRERVILGSIPIKTEIMSCFHFTLKDNVENILSTGLKINFGKSGFRKDNFVEHYIKHFGIQPIFLTINPVMTIETMLGNSVSKYSLLEIDINPIYKEVYPKNYKDQSDALWDGFSFVYFNNINQNLCKLTRFQ